MVKKKTCCFSGCFENNLTSKLYTFPSVERGDLEVERCLLWRERAKNISLLDVPLKHLNGYYHVCKKHFSKYQFCKLGSEVLKKTAVPEACSYDLAEIAGPSGRSSSSTNVDIPVNKKNIKRQCCATGCVENNLTSAMHSFPQVTASINGKEVVNDLQVKRCKVWLTNVANEHLSKIPLKELYDRYFLCSKHFSREQLLFKKLKKTAVPDIFHDVNISTEPLVVNTTIPFSEESNMVLLHQDRQAIISDNESDVVQSNAVDHEGDITSSNLRATTLVDADESTSSIIERNRFAKRRCSAPKCNNTNLTSKMHAFPSLQSIDQNGSATMKDDAIQRIKIWVRNTGNSKLTEVNPYHLRRRFYLCASHFDKDCYTSRGSLKTTAVPTLFLPHPLSESKFHSYEENVAKVLKSGEASRMSAENVPSTENTSFENTLSSTTYNANKRKASSQHDAQKESKKSKQVAIIDYAERIRDTIQKDCCEPRTTRPSMTEVPLEVVLTEGAENTFQQKNAAAQENKAREPENEKSQPSQVHGLKITKTISLAAVIDSGKERVSRSESTKKRSAKRGSERKISVIPLARLRNGGGTGEDGTEQSDSSDSGDECVTHISPTKYNKLKMELRQTKSELREVRDLNRRLQLQLLNLLESREAKKGEDSKNN